jgi:hypothetical protein
MACVADSACMRAALPAMSLVRMNSARRLVHCSGLLFK